MIRETIVLLFSLSLAGTPVRAQYVGPDQKEIRLLKSLLKTDSGVRQQYDALKRVADAALNEDPAPIDTIRSEGLLQGDPRKTATWAALRDMHKMYALALVYKVSRDKKYLKGAARYIMAWAATTTSRGDPIDDTNLDPAIEAFDMVKGDLPSEQTAAITNWLRQTADAEIHAPYNRPGRATSFNNWHSHRLKIVGEIAFTIGDTALQGYTTRGLKEQIARNLNPDGSSADFVTRDALHYHVYDLEPLLTLAIVLQKATGVDYYARKAASGSSIRQSVEWLLPFLDGRQTHAEFVNSTVEFDRRRALNGEKAYQAGTLFDPKNGVATLVLAAWFDPGLLQTARQLLGTNARYPTWQSVVNALWR
jgi:hypothetical protein